jgi:hypothetical protein
MGYLYEACDQRPLSSIVCVLLGFYIAILFSVTTGTYGTEKNIDHDIIFFYGIFKMVLI